jgi:hypothetical protein
MATATPSFSVDWLEKDRSIHVVIHQNISGSMVKEIQSYTSEYFRRADRNLHAIVDIRNMSRAEPSVETAKGHIRPISSKNHGATIIIVPPMNPLLKFIAGATMRAIGRPFHLCYTMDEALLILAGLE